MKKAVLALLPAFCGVMLLFPAHLRGAKPSREQPATVAFRCAATGPDTICPSDAAVSDGIRGDGASYSAVLNANGELQLVLSAGGGRTLWLDFRNGPGPSCPTCRRDFDTLFLDSAVVQTNVVDASGVEITGGLTSIPVGGTSASRLKVAFNRLNSLGQTVQWAVRFNPESYPGSDHVTARRLSTNTWEVEAYPTDRAMLPSNIFRKNGTDQIEGPFLMPFKMTVVSAAP